MSRIRAEKHGEAAVAAQLTRLVDICSLTKIANADGDGSDACKKRYGDVSANWNDACVNGSFHGF